MLAAEKSGQGIRRIHIRILKLSSLIAISTWLMACSPQHFSVQGSSETFGTKVFYNTNVDILWVVEDSGSMGPRQSALAGQVAPFMNALSATGMNYQMAVTTMDMSATGEQGRFLAAAGTPTIITPATPDVLSVISDRINNVGSAGAPLARGLEAAIASFSSPWIASGQPNAGFLRAGALNVLIFVSDKDDSSASANYAALLDSASPPFASGNRSWVADYIGILPNDPNCQSSQWQYNSPGTAFIALANASNGVTESICSANYAAAVAGIQAQVLSVLTEYPLNGTPSVSTIVVYLNGVLVPNDPNNGWTYDSTTNSVEFHGSFIPTPTSTINVTFQPASLG